MSGSPTLRVESSTPASGSTTSWLGSVPEPMQTVVRHRGDTSAEGEDTERAGEVVDCLREIECLYQWGHGLQRRRQRPYGSGRASEPVKTLDSPVRSSMIRPASCLLTARDGRRGPEVAGCEGEVDARDGPGQRLFRWTRVTRGRSG
jgi:hypothetical protein